ncbi:MAG: glycosyltransferase family 2 protein, partial [Bacteroidetes bacterium]
MNKLNNRVTIGFVNFNNGKFVEECIQSVIAQDSGPFRMIFVDNASTDGSFEHVKEKFGDLLEWISLKENRGPNPARNIILKKANTEFVLFLDADVVLEKDVVSKLVASIEAHPQAAVASPLVLDYENRTKVQFCGTLIHYIGAAIHPNKVFDDTYEVSSLGGACLLVRKSVADKIQGWDEDLFFGWTDGDFVYRMVLAGYKALCVSKAKIYHPYKKRGLSRAYHQIRNRWYFMLKTYSWRTLLLIFPVIFFYEMLLLVFLTLKKQSFTYFKANFSILLSLPQILKKRHYIQNLRKLRDRDTLTIGNI